MPNEKVVQYIKKALARGRTKEQIYKSLLTQGWGLDSIEVDFRESTKEETKEHSNEIWEGILTFGLGWPARVQRTNGPRQGGFSAAGP